MFVYLNVTYVYEWLRYSSLIKLCRLFHKQLDHRQDFIHKLRQVLLWNTHSVRAFIETSFWLRPISLTITWAKRIVWIRVYFCIRLKIERLKRQTKSRQMIRLNFYDGFRSDWMAANIHRRFFRFTILLTRIRITSCKCVNCFISPISFDLTLSIGQLLLCTLGSLKSAFNRA